MDVKVSHRGQDTGGCRCLPGHASLLGKVFIVSLISWSAQLRHRNGVRQASASLSPEPCIFILCLYNISTVKIEDVSVTTSVLIIAARHVLSYLFVVQNYIYIYTCLITIHSDNNARAGAEHKTDFGLIAGFAVSCQ